MKKLLSLLLGVLGFAACSSAQSDSIQTVPAEEFAQIIKADSVILVDVRTAGEYDAGHIENARNIDVLKDTFRSIAIGTLPKDKTIAVYCRSGKRSLKAAAILAKEGYKVINLRGGWMEWTEYKR
ncbi:MAG: rhodanese-like domain-containing protein [Prevotella sp.]|jgi:rhodanese-related sulfurtransferase|nr:rhodanese-like domain-containing protein [Prevotella sp.]